MTRQANNLNATKLEERATIYGWRMSNLVAEYKLFKSVTSKKNINITLKFAVSLKVYSNVYYKH